MRTTLHYNNEALNGIQGKVTFSESSENGLIIQINTKDASYSLLGNNIPNIECGDMVIIYPSPEYNHYLVGLQKIKYPGGKVVRQHKNKGYIFK